jgi:hypothetical protein
MENYTYPHGNKESNSQSMIIMDSPSFQQQTACHNLLSTPKANKSIQDSKSPLGKIRLKKSKRRECTPAYSPKKGEEEKKFSLTEKKPKEPHQQRLNFEGIEVNNTIYPRVSFDGVKETVPKKKFLSLIEESVNEVSDNYYGLLGSQTTPDIIFNTIFSEDKKEKNLSSNILPAIESTLREINQKNFNLLIFMKTQIFYFDNSLSCFEVSPVDFLPNFSEIKCDFYSSSIQEGGVIFLPGSIILTSGQKHNLRLIFEVIFGFSGENQVRLAVIEIHPICA